jgi:hypothetical protein
MIQQKKETRLLLTRATAGDTFMHGGHRYEVVGVSRYRTEAGCARLLVTLTARCEVCGESYQVTTGRTPTWIPRTCPLHRGRGPRRAPGAGAALAQAGPDDAGQGQTSPTAGMDAGGLPEGLKRCGCCGRVFPVGDFYRHRHRADGLDDICKSCRKRKTNAARREKRGRGLCADCGRESGGARYCLDCLGKRRDHRDSHAVKPMPIVHRCSTCGRVKLAADFYARPWGPSSSCRACQVKYQIQRAVHWRALGLCGRCGGPVDPGAATCKACRVARYHLDDSGESNVDPNPASAAENQNFQTNRKGNIDD